MKKFSFIIIAAAALLSSCTIKVSNTIDKDEKQITKNLDLKDFNGIAIAGSGDVEYVQDSIYKVELIGSEEALKELKLEVKDSILEIPREGNNCFFIGKKLVISGNEFTVKISSPNLKNISIAGSGDFVSKKPLVTSELKASIAGSGDIKFDTITAKKVEVEIAGSGDVVMKEKNVDTTRFSIAGSGDIETYFDNCNVVYTSIAGSGDIRLSGNIKQLLNDNEDVNTDNLKITK